MPSQRDRTDAFFTLEGRSTIEVGSSRMRPKAAHVQLPNRLRDPLLEAMPDAERATVYVRGPIVRRDGTESARGSKLIFGRYGTPLDRAPQWVRDLVARVERMENADAEA